MLFGVIYQLGRIENAGTRHRVCCGLSHFRSQGMLEFIETVTKPEEFPRLDGLGPIFLGGPLLLLKMSMA